MSTNHQTIAKLNGVSFEEYQKNVMASCLSLGKEMLEDSEHDTLSMKLDGYELIIRETNRKA